MFEVAYPHQSTSDTNVGGWGLAGKSRTARFCLFGIYRTIRKFSLWAIGKVSSALWNTTCRYYYAGFGCTVFLLNNLRCAITRG